MTALRAALARFFAEKCRASPGAHVPKARASRAEAALA
jgi:hypothetical protein